MKPLFALLLMFPLIAFSQQKLNSRPGTILWRITPPGKEASYIIGTNHVYSGALIDSFPLFHQIAERAECIIVEAGENALPKDALAMPPSKAPFRELFDTAGYRRVDALVREMGIPGLEEVEKSGLPVQGLYMMMAGWMVHMRTGKPEGLANIDGYVMQQAAKRNLPLISLDSGFTFKVGKSGFSDAQTVAVKLGELAAEWESGKSPAALDERYVKGDIDYKLGESARSVATDRSDNTFFERNAYWLPQLRRAFGAQRCLVAVGYGHLMYREGILAMLAREGYRVEPVQWTERLQ
ncbi:TraB/GumN family protein [Chitinophaga lutea]